MIELIRCSRLPRPVWRRALLGAALALAGTACGGASSSATGVFVLQERGVRVFFIVPAPLNHPAVEEVETARRSLGAPPPAYYIVAHVDNRRGRKAYFPSGVSLRGVSGWHRTWNSRDFLLNRARNDGDTVLPLLRRMQRDARFTGDVPAGRESDTVLVVWAGPLTVAGLRDVSNFRKGVEFEVCGAGSADSSLCKWAKASFKPFTWGPAAADARPALRQGISPSGVHRLDE